MSRTVNEAAHAERRSAFLDTAQRLIGAKGYEQMTIQDVLDELGASKGALYHYFGSKLALLEGIVERYVDAAEAHLVECAADPQLAALDKLRGWLRYLAGSGSSAAEQRLLLAALPAWHSDDNARARQRVRARLTEGAAPLLARIIGQGMAEGVFTTTSAEGAGRVVIGLVLDLDDLVGQRMLAARPGADDAARLEGLVAAYGEALERVLGAPAGALGVIDRRELRAWLDASRDAQSAGPALEPEGQPPWHGATT